MCLLRFASAVLSVLLCCAALSCPVLSCLWLYTVLSCAVCCAVLLVAGLWLSVLSVSCAVSCGGLRDEDQYLLRHSSPGALDQDSPSGQQMLLIHLDCQDKNELQRTLARLENENR